MMRTGAPYLIAEVGVNFYDTAHDKKISPMEAAKLYIAEAQASGANAVKFQSYKAETLTSINSPAYWDLTKEPTRSQYELFKKFDSFNENNYADLCTYSKEKGIDFLSTPFDYHSADYLNGLVDMYKVSSSDITNIPFIKHIAKKGKPILLSVGASYLSEIDEAVRAIRSIADIDICLMHCVLSYPCEYSDANLRMIQGLHKAFPNVNVGYSDHTVPDRAMTVITTAYLYGASVIEKHFTLDKSLPGNDHYHAGDPKDFKLIASNLQLIKQIDGQENKTVLNCEVTSRREARRSLVLTRDLKINEVLTVDDIIAKRPGTGIPPKYIEDVLGKPVKFDLKKDTVLEWNMF